jgi:UDP-N-acetylglucosamine--N-acetylmuramyl-(pentapeptide) pyrophosphoryl-undecaprenol N-acetylglucosamine transferase
MKIILTGGGSAGHVSPHIALLPALKEAGFAICYIGGANGIEKNMIQRLGIQYYGIASGKLRRYASMKNITDIFLILKGFFESFTLIGRIKPDIVFSKGGFVAPPVAAAAWLRGVPVVAHESDLTIGLANRLTLPFARRICANFPETLAGLPKNKGVLTGTPIRETLFSGDRAEGMRLCNFSPKTNKPVILFMGGSLGAAAINNCLREALPALLECYRIIHLCGKGNVVESTQPGYAQFEFVDEELPHLFELADIAVTRAGANTLCELLALQKPHLLIPLTKNASRGDQLLNAASFERQGFSMVLPEETMTPETLAEAIGRLYAERQHFATRMAEYASQADGNKADGTKRVMRVICETVR